MEVEDKGNGQYDTGCKVVLDDNGQKVYFTISPPNEGGSCPFSRTFSLDEDDTPESYIPIN